MKNMIKTMALVMGVLAGCVVASNVVTAFGQENIFAYDASTDPRFNVVNSYIAEIEPQIKLGVEIYLQNIMNETLATVPFP